MSESKPVVHHFEGDTFAVNESNEQVTVQGTYGQDPDQKQHISWRTWVIVLLCALATLQNTFLGIAPAASAYSIAGPLKGNVAQRIWIVQAQSVPSIVTGPIFAIISDVYGRRYLLLGVWTLFCVAAVIGMTANGMNQIIAAQALSGVACGVSGIIYGLAAEIVPSIYRAYSQTIVNCAASAASVLALIAMGTATHDDPVNGWRWIFRTLLILNGILLLGFGAFYFPPPRTNTHTTFLQKVKTLDFPGYGLLLLGLVPLLAGLVNSSVFPWSDPRCYAPVIIGCVSFVACLVYEWKGTTRGFLDHRLFSIDRNYPLGLLLFAVEGSLFYIMNNIYPSAVNGLWAVPGSMDANARLLPFFLVIFVVGPMMSYYTTRTKDFRSPLTLGFLCFAGAMIGLAFSGTNGNMATGFNALAGIGFSAPLILLITLVQLSTPPLFIGVASALTIAVRTLGGCVGYAIAVAIYASKTDAQIPAAIIKATAPLGFNPQYLGPLIGFLMSGQGLDAIPGVNGQILGAASAALKSTQSHGYKIVWLAFLPGAVLAAIGCAFLKNPTDRMNYITDAPLNLAAVTPGKDVRDDSMAEKESA